MLGNIQKWLVLSVMMSQTCLTLSHDDPGDPQIWGISCNQFMFDDVSKSLTWIKMPHLNAFETTLSEFFPGILKKTCTLNNLLSFLGSGQECRRCKPRSFSARFIVFWLGSWNELDHLLQPVQPVQRTGLWGRLGATQHKKLLGDIGPVCAQNSSAVQEMERYRLWPWSPLRRHPFQLFSAKGLGEWSTHCLISAWWILCENTH